MNTPEKQNRAALQQRVRERLRPFDPVPTELQPALNRIRGIRAVVFDVYGTMMLSSAGDIAVHDNATDGALFEEAARAAGFHPGAGGTAIDRRWHELIHEEHARRKKDGVAYPEVEIREIWRTLIDEGLIERDADTAVEGEPVEVLSLEYELLNNRVAVEPTLIKTLNHLKARSLVLGIVSNAQFYTPLILEAAMDLPLTMSGLDPDLCVWSYREREGKPSTSLFEKLNRRLHKRNIRPDEVVFVGNDMLKDVLPASQTGFRTVLYAGDQRSLRMRIDRPECRSLKPDAIITQLIQLEELIS